MDKIILDSFVLETIIGTFPTERERKQEIIVSIEINTDLKEAGLTGDLSKSLDYFALYNEISEMAEKSDFFLLESLAEEIAKLILEKPLAFKVKIKITKPKALEKAIASIEIERKKDTELK